METHTDLPWEVVELDGDVFIRSKTERVKGAPYLREIMSDEKYPSKRADAELIVEACNNHALLEISKAGVTFRDSNISIERINKAVARMNADDELHDIFNWACSVAREGAKRRARAEALLEICQHASGMKKAENETSDIFSDGWNKALYAIDLELKELLAHAPPETSAEKWKRLATEAAVPLEALRLVEERIRNNPIGKPTLSHETYTAIKTATNAIREELKKS